MDSLTYLLRAYFHQDWDHTHRTWQGVIDDFLQDAPATVAKVPGEIDDMLGSIPDDAELQRVLLESMDYYPEEGYRVWLTAVRDRIVSSIGA